ncbi:MAG TPA: ABC transporter permease subunit, partial [Flavobacterium sp.]
MDQEPENNAFTPESLKKQFRLSEFLAEKIISSIAFLSIAIIVLIFVFVFKESLPLFTSGEKAPIGTETAAGNASNLQPEAYGDEDAPLKPESYGAEPEAAELKPEAYGEPAPELAEDGLKPEAYGDTAVEPLNGDETEAGSSAENSIQSSEADDGAANTWNTFFSRAWVPVSDNPRFGLLALFIGTLKVTIIAMLIAGPLAILAALYTSTFASKKAKEIIKPVIELLAAFPSVVIGFFALMVLASFFQNVFGYETRLNAFVGGVAMALAAIPIIYTIAEDALTAVPKTYSEASLALGASKWQTAFFVTLPAAVPGIFAAILLG